jgi:hypothetical protein
MKFKHLLVTEKLKLHLPVYRRPVNVPVISQAHIISVINIQFYTPAKIAGVAVAAAALILTSSPKIVEHWRRVKALVMYHKMSNGAPLLFGCI